MKAVKANHRLKWSTLSPNEVDRIAEQVRKVEVRKEINDGWDVHDVLKEVRKSNV